MAHVLVLDSTNEDIFFCGQCKRVFNTLSLFIDHKNNDCINVTIGISKEQHNITENNNSASTSAPSFSENKDEEISCKFCKKIFKKMKTLQLHQKMHDQKPYQCVICARCFIQNSHLQRHVMSHRVWPDGLSETTAKSTEVDLLSYSCLYCEMVLANYNQFRKHLKNHSSIKTFKCIQSQCNNFYDSVESLMHHVSSTHKTLTYTCHNCHKTFNTLEDAAAHYQSYNNTCIETFPRSELHKCSQCDSVFKNAEKLSLHMLTENHKKTCVHCNKTFTSDKRLRLHLQIHRQLKPYQCNICTQSFHMKKYLSSHMLKHGERQYTCMVCKCLFKRQDSLQRHMRTHQIRKLYKCPFKESLQCKKEFNRSDKLKLHLKYHTKRITMSNNKQKVAQQLDTGTVEICIVPLDSKNKE